MASMFSPFSLLHSSGFIHRPQLALHPRPPPHPSSVSSISPLCGCKLQTDPLPPFTQKEAVLQARGALSSLLEKPLKSLSSSSVKQRKQQRQARFRVELPLFEEEKLYSLLIDLLSSFSVGKRANPVCLAVFCHSEIAEGCRDFAYENPNLQILDMESIDEEAEPEGVQIVVVAFPKLPDLRYVESITTWADRRPVVLVNPEWISGGEEGNAGKAFLESFDVIYSYLPLCIQGFFCKTEGAVLRHVKNGATAGEPWLVFVKEGNGMNCVTRLKERPNAEDLENALYNSAAANSPITRAFKSLKGNVGRQ